MGAYECEALDFTRLHFASVRSARLDNPVKRQRGSGLYGNGARVVTVLGIEGFLL